MGHFYTMTHQMNYRCAHVDIPPAIIRDIYILNCVVAIKTASLLIFSFPTSLLYPYIQARSTDHRGCGKSPLVIVRRTPVLTALPPLAKSIPMENVSASATEMAV